MWSESHLEVELGDKGYFPKGDQVTVFGDGQGHNGKVKRIFETPSKVHWYEVDFDEDKSDHQVNRSLFALVVIYYYHC